MELLSPAGSPEAVRAAVAAGADAVYLGYGNFNARRNAKNFSREELAAAVSYCHLEGVKVYLTLNTLVRDRELPAAAAVAADASDLGVDAVLVQDLGVVRMLRLTVPDLPVHASTQMTIHTLDGVKACADLGLTRAVLARELSARDIAYICQKSPIEIEVFIHGALCMCYSGQCYFSSVVGGRSGNRGLCAQPCRLRYGWSGRADEYPLSLKDLSLAGRLKELKDMGVASAKIEGRMKRPEYVYIVTEIYARALREGREPTKEDLRRLEDAFSRQGFTQGYFDEKKGPEMFGVREEKKEPKELFAAARTAYKKGDAQRVAVKLYAMVRAGEPVQVAAEDDRGRVVTAAGNEPEKARTKEVTAPEVESQLAKTGGTVYTCRSVKALVEPGLSVPLSAVNGLRRKVLDELSAQRTALPPRRSFPFKEGARFSNRRSRPEVTLCLRTAAQLTQELVRLGPALIYLPVHELAAHPESAELCARWGVPLAAALPRISLDRELPELARQLKTARTLGIDQALVQNLGQIELAKRLGFVPRGGFGIPIYNTQGEKECKRLGLRSVTASFELRLSQIRDLSKAIDTEMIAYGRLPLMLTENCIVKNRAGRCTCSDSNVLTDRKGVQFPVVSAPGCRSEILNGSKLFLADKAEDYAALGLWAVCLLFTTENPFECVSVAERYIKGGIYEPGGLHTRGLYYRDVE